MIACETLDATAEERYNKLELLKQRREMSTHGSDNTHQNIFEKCLHQHLTMHPLQLIYNKLYNNGNMHIQHLHKSFFPTKQMTGAHRGDMTKKDILSGFSVTDGGLLINPAVCWRSTGYWVCFCNSLVEFPVHLEYLKFA